MPKLTKVKSGSISRTIVKTLKSHGIKKAGIFGSYARGEQRKGSDVDILVQPTKDMNLLGFVHVKHELEDRLKMKVDLVRYRGIHPLLKKQIMKEQVKII